MGRRAGAAGPANIDFAGPVGDNFGSSRGADGFSVRSARVRPWKVGDSPLPHVQVREDESFENALRRFKRKCEKAGVLTELKKRQHYEKPSVKRKRKEVQARKKILRRLAEERRLGLR